MPSRRGCPGPNELVEAGGVGLYQGIDTGQVIDSAMQRIREIRKIRHSGLRRTYFALQSDSDRLHHKSTVNPYRRIGASLPEGRNVGSWAMAQPTLPPDKTFRMVVKLVSTDGIDLPFKGFGLVPEERLNLLERVSAAARDVGDVARDVNRTLLLPQMLKNLGDRVSELEKIWDIPRTAPA